MPAGDEIQGPVARRVTASTRGGRRKQGDEPQKMKIVAVQLLPEQLAVLQREARHRALVRACIVPDESEILREALDDWIARRS